MERGEPTLVPEWLRTSGNTHHFAFSSHSDILSTTAPFTRNRSSKSATDKNSTCSSVLDQTSSSNYRNGLSSNGLSKHPFSSFSRNHRDKPKEQFLVSYSLDVDSYVPLRETLPSRYEKNSMRQSPRLVGRKPADILSRRVVGLGNGGRNSSFDNNGPVTGSSIRKATFEKDFPSLGSEMKQGTTDVARVPSPGLSKAVQNLSLGGINMAVALSQVSSQSNTAPQVLDKTQMREELSIKQSRQLIPMPPALPKPSVYNSLGKLKPKVSIRNSEMTMSTKGPPQKPLLSSHHSIRDGQTRSDASSPRSTTTTTANAGGKFLVLKPLREIGASPAIKDVVTTSSTNNGDKVTRDQLPAAASLNPTNPKSSGVERKVDALTSEKKASFAHAQSRRDFFNLMRKKSSVVLQDTKEEASLLSSPSNNINSEVVVVANNEISCCTVGITSVTSNGEDVSCNNDDNDGDEKNTFVSGSTVSPDEEEVAFLRSLGWEENDGEDEGLTEEEINAFYEEYIKLRPTMKIHGCVQPKVAMLSQN
ncbi:uncharacterized protein LOC124927126 [Impatiens glandulifera]|uniref:uncharacterized protein LOC124927126 n=1 Tax=Impatiens glandulifera TaxID=253017 RepID=UPI001FB0773C|nr:uncharacterized protein LOC124927126 [Impatiens glandulifera]XP_047323436.1 uncharacterized protein LOC124927126 [Impatiens glandulifera]